MSKPLLALLTISCLALSSQAMAVEGLGRLFTTPEERTNLDYLRQTTKAEVLKESTDASVETMQAAPVLPSSISMQGYVKRSDGKKGTVWVNHQPMREDSTNSEVEVGKLGRDGNQVQLKLPANGKNFNLKAGQVYLPESNSVTEIHTNTKPLPSQVDVEEIRDESSGTSSKLKSSSDGNSNSHINR